MSVGDRRKPAASNGETKEAADKRLLLNIIELVPTASHPDVLEALKQDAIIRQKGQALPTSVSQATRLAASAKAVATLWVLYCLVLPLSLLVAGGAWAVSLLRGFIAGTSAGIKPTERRGTALVTGGNKTKALHVCRHLSRAGWRVVMVDGTKNWSCCSRFSNSVDKFYVVPVPNVEPLQYLKAMARIGARENVELFVPVSIAQYSVYEALAAELLPKGCHSTSLPAPDVRPLDNTLLHGFALTRQRRWRFCVLSTLPTKC